VNTSAREPISLQQELDALLHDFLEQVPPEVATALREATAEISRSGIAQQCLGEGMPAPDFELPDQAGEPVRLSALLARGPVVLSFFRGGWCPFCTLELTTLQKHLDPVRALGGELVAVSPQSRSDSRSTAERNRLAFPVLSDAGSAVARQYGLVYPLPAMVRPIYLSFGIDLPTREADGSYELPVPATYVIDRDGVIRLAFADSDYTRRLEPEAILETLRTLA